MFSSLSSGVTKGMKSLGLSSETVRVNTWPTYCGCHIDAYMLVIADTGDRAGGEGSIDE